MLRIVSLIFAACICFVPAAFAQLETSGVTIVSEEAEHDFIVEIVNTPEGIRTGLMFRESLAPDAGMLFDFGDPRQANMWMKNTLIPLDMLFMDAEGQIIAVAHNTVPGSLRTVGPGVPVKSVLEINGGVADELGIEPGDIVKHPIFGNMGD